MTTLRTHIDLLFFAIIETVAMYVERVIYEFPPSPWYVVVPNDESMVQVDVMDDADIHDDVVTEEVPAFKPIKALLRSHTAEISEGRNKIMYAGNVSTPIYINPTIEFDTEKIRIPYGELVMMLEARGRFYRVQWGMNEGWVLKDDLADRAAYVYPEFVPGEENTIDGENTSKIRTLLNDPFGLRHSEFSLQAGEYVLYRLWRKGISITWPPIRPRTQGLWHTLLKGLPNIHIGVTPKAGSIMEYVLEHEIGHLAYVEAVYPDQSISISEVNYPSSGIYSERILSKSEWLEIRPVFISAQS